MRTLQSFLGYEIDHYSVNSIYLRLPFELLLLLSRFVSLSLSPSMCLFLFLFSYLSLSFHLSRLIIISPFLYPSEFLFYISFYLTISSLIYFILFYFSMFTISNPSLHVIFVKHTSHYLFPILSAHYCCYWRTYTRLQTDVRGRFFRI